MFNNIRTSYTAKRYSDLQLLANVLTNSLAKPAQPTSQLAELAEQVGRATAQPAVGRLGQEVSFPAPFSAVFMCPRKLWE